jgi:hypothetical protein
MKKQSQFKANSKNERFCVDKEPYNDINNHTRGIYHPKECQTNPISIQSRISDWIGQKKPDISEVF